MYRDLSGIAYVFGPFDSSTEATSYVDALTSLNYKYHVLPLTDIRMVSADVWKARAE